MTSNFVSHRSLFTALFTVALAAVGITPAHAQAPQGPQDPYTAEDDDGDDDADDGPYLTPPDQGAASQAPSDVPTAPPAEQPAPPAEQPPPPTVQPPPPARAQVPPPQVRAPAPAPAPRAASGQWVFTQQYGWVWMPYGDQYVYSPEGAVGAVYPSAYVYRPVYGWTWLAAPWVWGVGPRIYFSVGPRYYGWYGHRFGHRGYARPVIRGYGGYRGGYVRGGYRGYRGYRGYGGRGHVIIRGHGGHRR